MLWFDPCLQHVIIHLHQHVVAAVRRAREPLEGVVLELGHPPVAILPPSQPAPEGVIVADQLPHRRRHPRQPAEAVGRGVIEVILTNNCQNEKSPLSALRPLSAHLFTYRRLNCPHAIGAQSEPTPLSIHNDTIHFITALNTMPCIIIPNLMPSGDALRVIRDSLCE